MCIRDRSFPPCSFSSLCWNISFTNFTGTLMWLSFHCSTALPIAPDFRSRGEKHKKWEGDRQGGFYYDLSGIAVGILPSFLCIVCNASGRFASRSDCLLLIPIDVDAGTFLMIQDNDFLNKKRSHVSQPWPRRLYKTLPWMSYCWPWKNGYGNAFFLL